MTNEEIITRCDDLMRTAGANAIIVLRVPGKYEGVTTHHLHKDGPTGNIYADTFDEKNLLVGFKAAEVKTYLQQRGKGRTNNDRAAT